MNAYEKRKAMQAKRLLQHGSGNFRVVFLAFCDCVRRLLVWLLTGLRYLELS
jgi:hypothetical protein